MREIAEATFFLKSFLQDLKSEVLSSRDSGRISAPECDRAISGLRRDFPSGIGSVGADALRFGLCSYDVKGEC